jgi:hypothetical protein
LRSSNFARQNVGAKVNQSIQLIKWLTVPTLIVGVQAVFDAKGMFVSNVEVWGFIGTSLIMLLVWRHRLGQFASRLTQRPFPSMENADRDDRRFAALSLSLPFVVLFALQLAILALVVACPSWLQPYVWTLWTIFGITAVACWQIVMAINYFIISHSSRWDRIFATQASRPPAQ